MAKQRDDASYVPVPAQNSRRRRVVLPCEDSSARLAVKVLRFSAGDASDAADLQASYAGGMRER